MAEQRSHLSVSTACAIGYAALGAFAWKINLELVLLGAILVTVAGLLPNVDSGPSSDAGKKLIGFLSAIAPICVIAYFPGAKTGGIARLALVVVASFVGVQVVSSWLLQKFFHHRGLLHSVPAAIIIFEVFYLLFWDLFPKERLYLGGAAFIGFASHLLLDATSNIDLVGNKEKKTPVLKLAGVSWQSTFALYSTAVLLGWFVLKDLSPALKIYGGVSY
jgi:hypothetical protein